MPFSLSLIVHTRNSAAKLPRMLSTTCWIQDRIVVDMQSDDGTAALAKAAGCRIINIEPSDNVDAIRDAYLPLAENDWTLVLDSDEYLSEDAESEIGRLIEDLGTDFDAIAIPRFNYIAGQLVRGGGWYPDQQTRLFRTGTVSWPAGHHQRVVSKTGPEKLHVLRPPDCLHIHHDNYDTIADVIERQVRYALTDVYPDTFSFHDYLQASYVEFERRFEPEKDGEISEALAIIMSWDKIIRGIIHWERNGRIEPLGSAFALPIVVDMPETEELADMRIRVAAMKASTSWRITAPLRWISSILKSLLNGRRAQDRPTK